MEFRRIGCRMYHHTQSCNQCLEGDPSQSHPGYQHPISRSANLSRTIRSLFQQQTALSLPQQRIDLHDHLLRCSQVANFPLESKERLSCSAAILHPTHRQSDHVQQKQARI